MDVDNFRVIQSQKVIIDARRSGSLRRVINQSTIYPEGVDLYLIRNPSL